MNVEKKIAKNLLDIKAVSLRPNEPFTWASGIKSPIYCDNRLVLSYPEKRTAVVEGFVELIKKEYPEAEILMGTATAGISWAALVADMLKVLTKTMEKEIKLKEICQKGQKLLL